MPAIDTIQPPQFVTHGKDTFEHFISAADMDASDEQMFAEMHERYAGIRVVLLSIDNGGRDVRDRAADYFTEHGSVFDLADIRVSSMDPDGTSRGNITLERPMDIDVEGRVVLAMDDIFDRGHTISFMREHLAAHRARRAIFATSLGKLGVADRVADVKAPEHVGRWIDNVYVIGRNLDGGEMPNGKTDPSSRLHRDLYQRVEKET